MTVCPTEYGPGVTTFFTISRAGGFSSGTLCEDGGEVTSSPPEVPVAMAVLSIDPFAASAAVTV